MYNYHTQLVAVLQDILPTFYELNLEKDTPLPCISYQEKNNSNREMGDDIWYSTISYYIKVWGEDIETLQTYAAEVDRALRPLGFKRTSAIELQNPKSTIMQKVMVFEARAVEHHYDEPSNDENN